MEPTTVVIADDHLVLRAGICCMIEAIPSIKIIGEASNGVEAIQLVEELHPDILLLDVEMPVMDGIEALEILNGKDCPTKVIILSGHNDQGFMLETKSRGAAGYFIKGNDPSLLLKAILEVGSVSSDKNKQAYNAL